jgi:hypothetical protein
MNKKNNDIASQLLKVAESRAPIRMTQVVAASNSAIKPNTIERGRTPVAMTPVQPKNASPSNKPLQPSKKK